MARVKQVPQKTVPRSFEGGKVPKKPSKKNKPGKAAIAEIRRLQKSAKLIIPKLRFQMLVKEILNDEGAAPRDKRIQSTALLALQEATEAFLTGWFNRAQDVAIHDKRVTVMWHDMHLALKLMHPDIFSERYLKKTWR